VIPAALSTAAPIGAPVLAGAAAAFAYITGMTAIARHETRRRVGARWPLVLLALPVATALACSRGEPAALALAGAFAAWVVFSARPLLAGDTDVGLAVSRLIAGICLLDAALIAGRGHAWIAAAAAAGTPLTRLLQRRVPGT
jgi:4-hydroxybenzoate polyprenyltransferase